MFNRSLGTGDSHPLLGGDAGGTEGDLSRFTKVFGLPLGTQQEEEEEEDTVEDDDDVDEEDEDDDDEEEDKELQRDCSDGFSTISDVGLSSSSSPGRKIQPIITGSNKRHIYSAL